MKIKEVYLNNGKKWIKLKGFWKWFYKTFHWLMNGERR